MTQRKPKSWAQYQELRRTNSKQYYKPSTQAAMVEDRLTLGSDKFYSKKNPEKDNSKATAEEVSKVVQEYFGLEDD